VAYLHGKTIRERVAALIRIAHPNFREELEAKARELNYLPVVYGGVDVKSHNTPGQEAITSL
jgi:acyl-CoA hydrolase